LRVFNACSGANLIRIICKRENMEKPGTFPPSGDSSTFRMIDVGEKAVTRRRAVASGRIHMAVETVARIRMKDMPKGDVLAMAEVAGIMAAKNTSSILPLCHPLALDAVRVYWEIEQTSIRVTCEAICHGKTGVEMEALTGASAALLCVYDLTKVIDPVMEISGVRLELKEGGKSGVWRPPTKENEAAGVGLAMGETIHIRRDSSSSDRHEHHAGMARFLNVAAAAITLSDRCSRGEARDESGPLLADYLNAHGATVREALVLPDDREELKRHILRLAESGIELILTSGGTGLGPRDVSPEAVREIASRRVEGIGELLRSHGAKYTNRSWLSRSEAYVVGKALVVLFPGSPKAVKQGLEAVGDVLPHAIQMVRGGNHEVKG
jgi:molybdenum cofactor biosynthesis protein MoaC